MTLFNAGGSDTSRIALVAIPRSKNGLLNYYRARVTEEKFSQDYIVKSFCFPLDLFNLAGPIRLVKIDVEGHEINVLRGMQILIARDRPLLIVESNSSGVSEWLSLLDYRKKHLSGSPNVIFQC